MEPTGKAAEIHKAVIAIQKLWNGITFCTHMQRHPFILKSYPFTVLLTQDTFKTNYDEVSEHNAIPSPGTLQ